MNTSISVVIPTYNRAKFLASTIESVLNQSVPVDEIIVIDDGSSDGTKELLNHYDIRYSYQENSGVSSARNHGIKIAKNEWICFLDSDDIWYKDKIKNQIQLHNNNPSILFSYTDEKWIYNNKEIKQKKYQEKTNKNQFLDHIKLCKIGSSSVMIHKTIFENIGFFDENLEACEDYDLWLRILRDYKVAYIDEKLVDKIAGHHGQLSFTTIGMDYYRILALQKHLNSEYTNAIENEIKIKKEILLKGAIKHNNRFFIDFCTE